MRLLAFLLLAATTLTRASSRAEDFTALAQASLAPLEGRIVGSGLGDSVEVIRDRWGVPHIYARNPRDLFFAQGFVQAQDRLWQMELYRRTWSGELAELMGPGYLAHDRLVRLLQYRGPWDNREWSSYHPDGRMIFQAFADGVNAWIDQTAGNLPVEFKLTGIVPGRWTARTSLLRSQTAFPLNDARAELNLAWNVVQFGLAEANRRARPSPYRDLVVPSGIDLARIGPDVVAALSGLRTDRPRPPLIDPYRSWPGAGPEGNDAPERSPGSNNWVVSGRLTASGKVLLANDPHRNVANPSIRYLVHLEAPGWRLIGATEPVLPGVAIGHNGRIAWGLTIVGTDQSDVYVEQVNPANRHEVWYQGRWEPLRVVIDTIRVKDAAPAIVSLRYSRHGPVFYEDTVHHVAYAIRSTMHEPGSAGYLSALRYHAVGDCREFLAAQVYYRAPTENMICGDIQGNIAWHASGAAPRRPNWHGRLPVPGTGEFEWAGFREDLPRELNPARGWIATANHDIHPPGYDPPLFFKNGPQTQRYDRLAELLAQGSRFTRDAMARMQHDALNRAAARDIPLFQGWTASEAGLESTRALLAGWDGWQRRESRAAALYRFVSPGITAETRAAETPPARRRELLEEAMRTGLTRIRDSLDPDPAGWRWGRVNRSALPHALVRAYDIPAVERSGGTGTVAASGATYRQVIDLAALDSSLATNVPGQSGQPGSPYYANLTESFGRGEYFPLSFSRVQVEQHAAHRLILLPQK